MLTGFMCCKQSTTPITPLPHFHLCQVIAEWPQIHLDPAKKKLACSWGLVRYVPVVLPSGYLSRCGSGFQECPYHLLC